MLDRAYPVLRIVCFALAALLVYQVVHLAASPNPLKGIRIPEVAAEPATAGTNASTPPKLTNSAPATNSPKAPSTVKAPDVASAGKSSKPGAGPRGRPPGPPPTPAPGSPAVERIIESEIFGPVPHPMPMALLGIAGPDAFIRAPNGQTGLLREGEELGGIKLLRIGTNRVLVEEAGQQKELTIFEGFGSETLLPKGKENPQ